AYHPATCLSRQGRQWQTGTNRPRIRVPCENKLLPCRDRRSSCTNGPARKLLRVCLVRIRLHIADPQSPHRIARCDTDLIRELVVRLVRSPLRFRRFELKSSREAALVAVCPRETAGSSFRVA